MFETTTLCDTSREKWVFGTRPATGENPESRLAFNLYDVISLVHNPETGLTYVGLRESADPLRSVPMIARSLRDIRMGSSAQAMAFITGEDDS